MVRVDVHVQHAPEAGEELVDGENDVVDIAEAVGVARACMVHAAGPIYSPPPSAHATASAPPA